MIRYYKIFKLLIMFLFVNQALGVMPPYQQERHHVAKAVHLQTKQEISNVEIKNTDFV